MCLSTSNYWFETIMCSIFIFNYVDKSNGDVREPMEVTPCYDMCSNLSIPCPSGIL